MLRTYLHLRRAHFLAVLVAIVVFSAAFFLYDLPMEALLYPGIVCAVLALIAMIADFSRVRSRRSALTAVRNVPLLTPDDLPEADAYPEKEWRAIAEALALKNARERENAHALISETADYYSTWAHQIKTPIAAMQVNLQNEDTPLSRTLRMELRRVEQYVEMALTFARLDSESTDYVFRNCALDDILRSSIRRFSAEFIARRLKLIFTESGAHAVTDEKWLRFVVEQVLSNALKYTRAGTISVFTQAGPRIVIRDTGIGIAPEDLPRVFEKGYTGFNGRIDGRASGVGLYLCRRVCQNLGATISVSSILDEGTTVTIDLTQRPATGD